ncbi:hypothetical protein AX17_003767 [Amanita inopinata Kibby_2008]|nr:hypothetical protein AX17_003767 [Amanita inopinata Kibby_2008]
MPFTSMLEPEHQELLSSSIAHPAPFCSGTFRVSPADLVVYYGKERDACRIDLRNPSTDFLKHLADACDPATFGRGHEDVYDESYRKAGKLGSEAFRPTFDPTNLGLIHVLRQTLLRGLQAERHIRAELYNINVYGEGSFFKAHKDTPRGEQMFGSLVIFYPTPHEGGALIMRKDGKEWMFDSAKELAEHNEPHVGYVALYSDVEHEVALVTSGYRVTVTYNLYFDESTSVVDVPLSVDALDFRAALETLLDNPKFLPDGGNLGFGLEYQYPLPGPRGRLNKLEKRLKGSDAEIMDIIKELSLDVSLWGIIEWHGFKAACKDYFPDYTHYYAEEWDLAGWLQHKYGAKIIEHYEPEETFEFSPPAHFNYWVSGTNPSLTRKCPEQRRLSKVSLLSDQERMFESSKALAEHNEPHIGYVALYSDVEHEVALVTSGYITYNLYFDESAPVVNVPLSPDALAFRTAFERLLDDPEFLPNGG